jgi:hypothetical protein
MWFSHPHVCDQLLWINGYSCTYAFLLRGGPNTSSNFISICIIKIFPTLPDYSKYFWPGSVITRGVGAGGWWQLLTQQASTDEQPNFEWYRQKLLAGKEKENSQIFNADFYLPLYLPLWLAGSCVLDKYVEAEAKKRRPTALHSRNLSEVCKDCTGSSCINTCVFDQLFE